MSPSDSRKRWKPSQLSAYLGLSRVLNHKKMLFLLILLAFWGHILLHAVSNEPITVTIVLEVLSEAAKSVYSTWVGFEEHRVKEHKASVHAT